MQIFNKIQTNCFKTYISVSRNSASLFILRTVESNPSKNHALNMFLL